MSNIVNGLTEVAISLLLALLQWCAEVRGARQAQRITLQQTQLEARNVELRSYRSNSARLSMTTSASVGPA